ncbi:hypothetical protein [Viridibacillus arvi]|uniref:hypothetical protein n=1 Tax=Viridibacillus arvi TaxID=263475 RepID=UPI0034CD9AAE
MAFSKIHLLLDLLRKDEVKEIILLEGLVNEQLNRDLGPITREDCLQFLAELQKDIVDQPIIPAGDKRLIIYTGENYRLVVNDMLEGKGFNITVKKR